MTEKISDNYQAPVRIAFVLSIIIAVPTFLLLDGGQIATLTCIALLVFWGWVLFAIWRRPQTPTRLDLLLIRWGSLPFVVAFNIAMFYVWHLRGLL